MQGRLRSNINIFLYDISPKFICLFVTVTVFIRLLCIHNPHVKMHTLELQVNVNIGMSSLNTQIKNAVKLLNEAMGFYFITNGFLNNNNDFLYYLK